MAAAKEIEYKPSKKVCAKRICFTVEDGIVRQVLFEGGCHGNGQGIAALAEGMHRDELIARLSHIECKKKGTSCPAQLAKALRKLSE